MRGRWLTYTHTCIQHTYTTHTHTQHTYNTCTYTCTHTHTHTTQMRVHVSLTLCHKRQCTQTIALNCADVFMFSCVASLHYVKQPGAILHSGTMVAQLDLDDPSKIRQAERFTGGLPSSKQPKSRGEKIHQVSSSEKQPCVLFYFPPPPPPSPPYTLVLLFIMHNMVFLHFFLFLLPFYSPAPFPTSSHPPSPIPSYLPLLLLHVPHPFFYLGVPSFT